MTKRGTLLAIIIATMPVGATAAEVLTGKDAAYIDWAARNCGMKGTPKEHGLIDAARAKGAAAFENQYLLQFEDKKLAQALATPAQTRSMCEEIKSWYGASGSRIEGLVQAVSEPTAPAPTSEKKAAPKPAAGPNINAPRR